MQSPDHPGYCAASSSRQQASGLGRNFYRASPAQRSVQAQTLTIAATVASMFPAFSAATQMRPESTP